MKKTKDKTWVRQPLILTAMKRVFHRSPMYKAIKDAAKVPYTAKKKDGTDSKAHRVQFRCEQCKELFFEKQVIELIDKKGNKRLKKTKMIEIDHIDPVIKIETGFTDINTWVERQFVGFLTWDPKVNSVQDLRGKLQALCFFCHKTKSNREASLRAEARRARKAS